MENLKSKLTKEELKIFNSIMAYFPATDPISAFNIAIQGGTNFQFISK